MMDMTATAVWRWVRSPTAIAVAAAASVASCAARDLDLCRDRQRQLQQANAVVDGSVWVLFDASVNRDEAEGIVAAQGFALDTWLREPSIGQGGEALVRVPSGEECPSALTLRDSRGVKEASLRELARPTP
jgi:hypothetical protein